MREFLREDLCCFLGVEMVGHHRFCADDVKHSGGQSHNFHFVRTNVGTFAGTSLASATLLVSVFWGISIEISRIPVTGLTFSPRAELCTTSASYFMYFSRLGEFSWRSRRHIHLSSAIAWVRV